MGNQTSSEELPEQELENFANASASAPSSAPQKRGALQWIGTIIFYIIVIFFAWVALRSALEGF